MVKWLEKRAAATIIGATNAQPRDALRTELWPVSLVLRVVGAMPIFTDKRTGEHVFRVMSPALAHSVLVYLMLNGALVNEHWKKFFGGDGRSFDQIVSLVLFIFYDTLIVVIPWFYWMEAGAFARYLSQWTRLQADFEHVTGTLLHLGLRRRATVITCALCAGSVLIELRYALDEEHRNRYIEVVTFVVQDILRGLICARWYLQCKAIVAISEQALDQLKMEIAHVQSARLMEYRLLWLRLSGQTRATGKAFGYTHGFYLAYLLVSLVLAVYQTATDGRKQQYFLIDIVESISLTVYLFVFCDSAQRATDHVGNEWVDFLLRVRASSSQDMQNQIGDFLETCSAQAPVITLGEFVVINRPLLVSMASAVITYLVIIVQFKMGTPESVNIPPYASNVTE